MDWVCEWDVMYWIKLRLGDTYSLNSYVLFIDSKVVVVVVVVMVSYGVGLRDLENGNAE